VEYWSDGVLESRVVAENGGWSGDRNAISSPYPSAIFRWIESAEAIACPATRFIFESRRFKPARGLDLQRDCVLPDTQSLIPTILVLSLHHSTTPPHHHSSTPLLHYSTALRLTPEFSLPDLFYGPPSVFRNERISIAGKSVQNGQVFARPHIP
jgi:hypothetical protein